MHRTIKPHPHHLPDAAGIVAVRFVDLRFEHRLHVPRLNTDHRQARFGKRAAKPLRQRPGFQSNPLEVVGGVFHRRQPRVRFAHHLHFPNDLARVIHNADAGLLDRYVQSSKMVHAALLLLMLEAVNADLVFTISLKRSTQNLQLSTSSPADYPIFWGQSGHRNSPVSCLLLTQSGHAGPHSITSSALALARTLTRRPAAAPSARWSCGRPRSDSTHASPPRNSACPRQTARRPASHWS